MPYARIGTIITTVLLTSGTLKTVNAQASPYTDLISRDIKALSAEDIQALRSGAGMGYALAAELNHYPGPKHVLELSDSLALSPAQARAVNDIFAEMSEEARDLGEQLITAEAHIDSLFLHEVVSSTSLEESVTRASHVESQLRIVHLAAHLRVRALLNGDQRQTYDRLRGYGAEHQHIHRDD